MWLVVVVWKYNAAINLGEIIVGGQAGANHWMSSLRVLPDWPPASGTTADSGGLYSNRVSFH